MKVLKMIFNLFRKKRKMPMEFESKDPAYDCYNLLREAHDRLKWVGGFDIGGGPMRMALIDRVELDESERNRTNRVINRMHDDLYTLEKILSGKIGN